MRRSDGVASWLMFVGMIALVVSLTGTYTTRANERPQLILNLEPWRVVLVDKDGEVHEELRYLDDSEKEGLLVEPGDAIEYVLTVHNTTDDSLSDVVVALPVPPQSRVLPESTEYDPSRVAVQYSIDGGERFQVPPVRYWDEDEEGNQVQLIAGPSMYTDIRWVFLTPLAAKEAVSLRYRVQIR